MLLAKFLKQREAHPSLVCHATLHRWLDLVVVTGHDEARSKEDRANCEWLRDLGRLIHDTVVKLHALQ